MIEFHLDARSGVSPYLQLVQQVRQALRLGLLGEGDQLPTVKDVVAQVAINPNTVLKAYRELEHEGLVAARPGVGTFVTRTLTDASLAAHGPLRQDLRRWLAKARRAGLDEESIEALFMTTFRTAARRGRSVTAVLRAQGLGKRYGRRWALPDCTLDIPAGHGRRPGRPQRRRQVHPAEPGRRAADPDRGHDRGAAAAGPAAGPAQLAKVGFVAQDTPDLRRADRRRPPAARRPAQPRLGRRPGPRTGSSGSAWTPPSGPGSCPAASAPSSPSPSPSPNGPSC